MISYAQNHEDVVIARCFRGEAPQLYVDVGAGHPEIHSVTKHFYDQGWRGLNLEPRSSLWRSLRAHRPFDCNLCLAVSDRQAETDFFEVRVREDESGDNGGLSTLEPELAAEYRERGYEVEESKIQVRTLSNILADEGVHDIGFLKVDVEGHEASVLHGLDWRRWRPRLVIIESTLPTTAVESRSPAMAMLSGQDYMLTLFDGLNQFWLRREDEEKAALLKCGANVFDNFLPCNLVQHMQQLAAVRAENATLRQQLSSREVEIQRLRQHLQLASTRSTAASGNKPQAATETCLNLSTDPTDAHKRVA